MTIANNTYVTDQPNFINSYLSEVEISDLSIHDITTQSRVISSVDSRLNFSDSDITNIHTSTSSDFLSVSFQSIAVMNNITFTNSTVELVVVLLSSLNMTDLHISNIISNDYLFSYLDCNNIVMHDLVINQFRSSRDSMVLLSESSVDSINNFTISDSNVTGLHILKSNVTMMNEVMISNVRQSIDIQQSHIDMFYNSQLSHCGSQDIINGGAMYMENSNMTMQNITFNSNTAQVGGAVSINCDIYDS